jgi:hypothetical protein
MNLTATSWTTTETRGSTRASVGLVSAVRTTVGGLDAVSDVLVLHRTDKKQASKFFVLTKEPSLQAINQIVNVMVQLEDAFPGERFDYDTVPSASESFIPREAKSLLHEP